MKLNYKNDKKPFSRDNLKKFLKTFRNVFAESQNVPQAEIDKYITEIIKMYRSRFANMKNLDEKDFEIFIEEQMIKLGFDEIYDDIFWEDTPKRREFALKIFENILIAYIDQKGKIRVLSSENRKLVDMLKKLSQEGKLDKEAEKYLANRVDWGW